jgi:glycosyltransferase involved in cell wall biosynthesis
MKDKIIKVIIFFYLLFNLIYFDEKVQLEIYFYLCNKQELNNKYYFQKNKNPKVSIISPVYNREKYLIRFINSIQNQILIDIEIIFIDDFSKDNSTGIIENCQKGDQRILLIKNKRNRGTFISRNIGALKSKGEYLMFPDPDDILSKNIIQICYNFAENNKIEMIRFNVYLGKGRLFFNEIVGSLESIPVYQPDLSIYLFYGLGKLRQIDFNVSNKFVKRSSFIIALNNIKKYYLSLFMLIYEDGVMNFLLYRTVKSFYFLKTIGYYYIVNEGSITGSNCNVTLTQYLSYLYIYSKLVFDFIKNKPQEKNMLSSLLNEFLILNNDTIIHFASNDFRFYNNKEHNFYNYFMNVYLESKYTGFRNKASIKKMKYIIENNNNK